MSTITTIKNMASINSDDAKTASIALMKAAHTAIGEGDNPTFLTLHRVATILTNSTVALTFPPDYTSATDDERTIMAAEMGMDDGWTLALPRFHPTSTSEQADAYRTAYRDAAADRATTTLYDR
jgi:hypothetical protein